MRSIKPTLDMVEQAKLLNAAMPHAFNENDNARLLACRTLIKALRAPMIEGVPPAKVLTADVSVQLSIAFNDAVAQIIQAHIPRSTKVGRPAKAPNVARLELQTYKRLALELREALEKCEKESIAAAAAEPVGSIPSVDARRARMSQAGAPVHAAFSALLNAPTSCDHLREQAEAMAEDSQALAASIERWCTSQSLAGGKAHGVHKGKALPAWLEACKRLSRDIAQELRITPV